MKFAIIAAAIGLGATAALAQDVRLTPDEIKAAWTGKKVLAQSVRGGALELRLTADGKAALGGAMSDTGSWRLNETGYCATWLKIRAGKEACFTVVRRGTQTFVLNPDGSVNTEIVRIED